MTKKAVIVAIALVVLAVYVLFTMIDSKNTNDNTVGYDHNTPVNANRVDPNQQELYDKDGDGVLDIHDVCPQRFSVNKRTGCVVIHNTVDFDGDGVEDHHDRCPQTSGSEDLRGCPKSNSVDTDGDGILNQYDICPGFFGVKEYYGCQIAQSVEYEGFIHHTDDYKDLIKWNLQNTGDPFVSSLYKCVLNEIRVECPQPKHISSGWESRFFHYMLENIYEPRFSIGPFGYEDNTTNT